MSECSMKRPPSGSAALFSHFTEEYAESCETVEPKRECEDCGGGSFVLFVLFLV